MGVEIDEVSAPSTVVFAPSWGEGIDFADDRGRFAIIFIGGRNRQRAVAGSVMWSST